MRRKTSSSRAKTPLAYAIVLTLNGKKNLEYCLPTLAAQDFRGKLRILVVDNGSTDGSPEFVESKFPSFEVIRIGRNIGWPGGNNVGILHALAGRADYVFLLNDDTKLNKGFVKSIVAAGEQNPEYGIFGSKILYMGTKTLQVAGGGRFGKDDTLGAKPMGLGEEDVGQFDKGLTELDFVYEAAFAVKARVFEKVGLLDPEWFFTMEGPDLCKRASRAGFKCVLVPGAIAQHAVSATTDKDKNKQLSRALFSRLTLQIAKNGLRFMLKHYSMGDVLKHEIRTFADVISKSFSHPHLLPLSIFSLCWNLVHLPQTLALRKQGRENYEDLYRDFIKD